MLPRYLFVCSAVAVAAIGYAMTTMQPSQAIATGKNTASPASQALSTSEATPPIDKAVPPIIETASFGLG